MAVTLIAAVTTASSPLFSSSSSSSSSSYQIRRAASNFPSLPFVYYNSHSFKSKISQLAWNGLKHLPLINSCDSFFKPKDRRQRKRRITVHASLFGVGAPEALVIGVVALLVFGPKGLAEVARNLGKTLRAFQPTIRELQDVSREFKSTLEREIGLDEVSPPRNMYRPPPTPLTNDDIKQPFVDQNGTPKPEGYTSEDLLKITQEQLAASSSEPQTSPQEPSNIPQELNQDVAIDSIATSTPEAAVQNQLQSSEKVDKER